MKTRNYVILAMLRASKKAGAHGKTEKAQRKANKQSLRKEISVLH